MPNYLRGYPVLHELANGCPNVAPPPPDCRSPVPLVALNCSGNPGCELDGLTIIGSSGYEGSNGPRTAVRIYSGTAIAVTVIDGGRTGSGDVRDANDLPAGSWLSRSSGGWVIVGDAAAKPPTNAHMGVRGAAAEAHALLVGQSGEANARLGIGSDGAIRWRSTNSTAKGFDASLLGRLSTNVTYDAPSIKPGGWVKTTLGLDGAQPGDVVDATLTTLGEAAVFLSARVSSLGVVLGRVGARGPCRHRQALLNAPSPAGTALARGTTHVHVGCTVDTPRTHRQFPNTAKTKTCRSAHGCAMRRHSIQTREKPTRRAVRAAICPRACPHGTPTRTSPTKKRCRPGDWPKGWRLNIGP